MVRKLSSIALFVAGALMAIPTGSANAGAGIEGVWDCQVVRPGNLSERPLLYTFDGDGIATYSSQTNISNLGFTSRGGAFGRYRQVNANFETRVVENLYRNGNAGGRFFSDIVLHKSGDTLCSGSLPGDPCPTNGNVRATKFLFPDATSACTLDNPISLGDPICGEVDLLNAPPTGNGVVSMVLRCDRINTISTYGSSAPVFPIPNPVP